MRTSLNVLCCRRHTAPFFLFFFFFFFFFFFTANEKKRSVHKLLVFNALCDTTTSFSYILRAVLLLLLLLLVASLSKSRGIHSPSPSSSSQERKREATKLEIVCYCSLLNPFSWWWWWCGVVWDCGQWVLTEAGARLFLLYIAAAKENRPSWAEQSRAEQRSAVQFINLKERKESPAELLDLWTLLLFLLLLHVYNTSIARGYKWFFYSWHKKITFHTLLFRFHTIKERKNERKSREKRLNNNAHK